MALTVLTMEGFQIFNIFERDNLTIEGIGSVRGSVIEQILIWCKESCRDKVHYLPDAGVIKWIFDDPRDAMSFKLTWL